MKQNPTTFIIIISIAIVVVNTNIFNNILF